MSPKRACERLRLQPNKGGTSDRKIVDKWLRRVRFNSRALRFFEDLGWAEWIAAAYADQIDDSVLTIQENCKLHDLLSRLYLLQN